MNYKTLDFSKVDFDNESMSTDDSLEMLFLSIDLTIY